MSDPRFITTYTGQAFTPLSPEGCVVRIEDIARSLAFTCRFNGHTQFFYSVAQHSVLVTDHLALVDVDTDVLLQGLLHDASEAYLHDIVRPIKKDVSIDGKPYDEVEERLMREIFFQLGVRWPIDPVVWQADNVLLATEMRDLMAVPAEGRHEYGIPLARRISPWGLDESRQRFLARYEELSRIGKHALGNGRAGGPVKKGSYEATV